MYATAEFMRREGYSLRALSCVSKDVRLACLPHLFRRLHYHAAKRSTPLLEKYCKELKAIRPYLHFVKVFSIMPHYEGDPSITRVSLCTLCAIIKQLPNLEALDLVCFTWKGCRRPHDCLGDMPPLALRKLAIIHTRVVGRVDPLHILRLTSSVKHLVVLDVVPTEHISTLDTTSLATIPRKSLHVQLLMDHRQFHTTDRTKYQLPYYNNHVALRQALRSELSRTLVNLRVVWSLSHSLRGMTLIFSHSQAIFV